MCKKYKVIILLYLFRQEKDGLRHVPSETFVVPRCAVGDMPVAYHPAQDNCNALSCTATLQAAGAARA